MTTEKITKVDGVSGMVMNRADVPAVFKEDEVRKLMVEMFDRHRAYAYERMQGVEEAKGKRAHRLRVALGRMLKGRTARTSLRDHAESCIDGLPKDARKHVLGILAALDDLQRDEALDEFREPVYNAG